MAVVLGARGKLAVYLDQQRCHGHSRLFPELQILTQVSQVSIAIPTFNRGEILLSTLAKLQELEQQPREILIIDQTLEHPREVQCSLESLSAEGKIRYIRLAQPSIPHAMNEALLRAFGQLVLYLDDDIVPIKGLVEHHERAHAKHPELWATAGQVIQPWQKPMPLTAPRGYAGLAKDYDFPFHSTLDSVVENVMAGNLCVKRERALSIGGFDENFIGPAYRFETDFARRILLANGKIRFIASAGIYHLRAESGGTRANGNHLTSASPVHGFGDYYYAFKHGASAEAWIYSVKRAFREVRTKFHLTHPWWVPVKLFGEIRAFGLAKRRIKEGQRLLSPERLN